MLWLPTASMAVDNVAWPLPLSAPEPMFVAPSKNATAPVGVPLPELTVAVKFTLCPKVEGFGLEASVVVVEALFCTTVRIPDALVADWPSGLVSVMVRAPAGALAATLR
jgi:hypothetical protein